MRKRKIYIVTMLLIVLICSIFVLIKYIQCRNSEQEIIARFWNTVDTINTSFSYEGYEEIMKKESHVLGLPMESTNICDPNDFVSHQKQFVFMNSKDEGIILLQVTLDKEQRNRWNSSMSYRPMLYNHEESKYGNIYNPNIPAVDVSANSFSYGNCNYNIICIAKGSEGLEPGVASTLLVDFSNKLIEFILE